MFPAFAAQPPGFGAGAGAPAQVPPLVRFKAGKMRAEQKPDSASFVVTPVADRGEIVLTRGAEGQLLHFQWRHRVSKEVVDDYIVFADCEYKKVDTGRPDDRVYMLEWTGSARRFFFWMQDKDASKDEEYMAAINEHISSPGTPGETGATVAPGAAEGGLDWNAFNNVLQGSGAPPPPSAAANPGGLQLAQLQNVLNQMDLPAAGADEGEAETPAPAEVTVPPAADGADAPAAPSAGGLTQADMQRAMANLFAASSGPRTPALPLAEVLRPDNLLASPALQDEAILDRLLPHLPESQRSGAELRSTLSSPQFRSSLSQLSSALQGQGYESVLANLGLQPQHGAEAMQRGEPVEAFLQAVIAAFGQEQAGDEGEQE